MAAEASATPAHADIARSANAVSVMRAEFWNAAPDVELPREVTAAGLGLSSASLEKKAIEGGGPPYRKFGRRCLYRKGDVIAWLDANSKRVSNTSQLKQAVPA